MKHEILHREGKAPLAFYWETCDHCGLQYRYISFLNKLIHKPYAEECPTIEEAALNEQQVING